MEINGKEYNMDMLVSKSTYTENVFSGDMSGTYTQEYIVYEFVDGRTETVKGQILNGKDIAY